MGLYHFYIPYQHAWVDIIYPTPTSFDQLEVLYGLGILYVFFKDQELGSFLEICMTFHLPVPLYFLIFLWLLILSSNCKRCEGFDFVPPFQSWGNYYILDFSLYYLSLLLVVISAKHLPLAFSALDQKESEIPEGKVFHLGCNINSSFVNIGTLSKVMNTSFPLLSLKPTTESELTFTFCPSVPVRLWQLWKELLTV